MLIIQLPVQGMFWKHLSEVPMIGPMIFVSNFVMQCFFLHLFNLVPFPQINGELGTSRIPKAAAAQANAAAVAAAQQHSRQFDVSQPAPVQPQNTSSQAAPMTSPPLPGRMSPLQQMSVQAPSTQQAKPIQPTVAPLSKQQAAGQMSPSGQMMTPPRSQGKTPPRESGKNLPVTNTTQAQSPASQGDQSNSSGYVSATESKPNIQSQLNIKTEPLTPPPAQPQTGQVCCPCLSYQQLCRNQ